MKYQPHPAARRSASRTSADRQDPRERPGDTRRTGPTLAQVIKWACGTDAGELAGLLAERLAGARY